MNGLGHQFLANPGFAGDQHGQVAAADQIDFFHQPFKRFALADHFAILLTAGLTVDLGALVLVFSADRQALDALGGVDRGRGQAGEGLQGVQFNRLETLGVERIEGDQAPEFFIDKQWAAKAVVDFEVIVEAVDQTVVGIGQVAVGGEPGRAFAGQQHFKARMFADFEASTQGVSTQTVHRQWHQRFAVEAQQRGGITWQQSAHGFEQAPVALALGQFAGQVGDEGKQSGEQGFGSHGLVVKETRCSRDDYNEL